MPFRKLSSGPGRVHPPVAPRGRTRAAVAAALLGVLAAGCAPIPTLSTEEALERLNIASTKLYAADGALIANLHGEINRDIVPIEKIPTHVQEAVIAIEDQRFWQHGGVDAVSIGRALVSNVGSAANDDGRLQGGSTLSQQLVKNIYFQRPDRTVQRKVTEARFTVQFERQYSKLQILEMYLNTIYLGRGVYGFQTAARSYFDSDVGDLSLSQAAFLAGMIRTPTRYDFATKDGEDESRKHSAVTRRNTVLNRMVELGFTTPEQAGEAKAEDLTIRPRPEDAWTYPYFVDMVLRQLGVLRPRRSVEIPLDPRFEFLGATYEERARNVHRGGLRIYTTLDPKVQAAAEEAVEKVLPGDLRASGSLAAIEPKTGYVRALVGGRNYYPECPDDEPRQRQSQSCRLGKVNLALGELGGGSGRQPGSSFKPVVLAAALQRGISLRQSYSSAGYTQSIPGSRPWTVRNYEGQGGGHMNLVEGTVSSVNAVYAHLLVDGVGDGNPMEGAGRVAETARKLGVRFPTRAELRELRGCTQESREDRCLPADDVPSIALGAREVSPLDMASAYATFANEGVHVQPTVVARITDAAGKVLYEADPSHARVLPQAIARGITHVLKQVIDRGTGVKARLSRPAAGKTGTSQEWRDAWFAGYVPQLAAAVWVGNPETAMESMTPANGYPFRVVGGTFPANIWQYFMTKALADVPVQQFPPAPPELFGAVTATPAPEAEVPDVLGMTRDDAVAELRRAGFPAAERQCLDRRSPEGTVVMQTPAGGIQAPTGTAVSICISTRTLPIPGEPLRPGSAAERASEGNVPVVIGMSRAEAANELQRAGFKGNYVRDCDPDGTTQPGRIFRQSPEPGATVPRGTTVTMWYESPVCGQQQGSE